MPVPTALPIGLSDEFANAASRQALWRAFLKKNHLLVAQLPELVMALRDQLWPALQQAKLVSVK